MTSLKKLWGVDKESVHAALHRSILLLLDVLADHAVELDPEECAFHRTALRKVKDGFEQDPEADEISILSGGAAKSIVSYNESVENFHRAQDFELRGIVSVMGAALLRLSTGTETASQNLRRVERDLARASQIDDIRLLKSKLAAALEVICSEAERQEHLTEELRTELADMQGPAAQPKSTGSPQSHEAEEAIRQAAADGGYYLLVVVLERLETINARYGYEVGDQVLEIFSKHVAENLPKPDQVFRWRGACFVAIISRAAGLEAVRADSRRLTHSRLEHSVDTGGRSMLLTLSRASTVIPLNKPADALRISERIDAFAAEQNRRNSEQTRRN